MEELVGRHPDGIQEAVSLQVFINLWFGEGRIATKVVPILFVLVSLDDRVQNFLPTISAVNITRAQRDAFTIPELIEAEQRMETGTAEMTVVGRPFLCPMYRALRTVQVENDSRVRRDSQGFFGPESYFVSRIVSDVERNGGCLRSILPPFGPSPRSETPLTLLSARCGRSNVRHHHSGHGRYGLHGGRE